jgi:hypothetical protein
MKHMSILHNKISGYFNLEELKTLCMDLSVDFDSLPGQGKSEKIRELILYLNRTSRLFELADILPKDRPNVDWKVDIEQAAKEVLQSNISKPQQTETTASPSVFISGGSVGQVINAGNVENISGNFSFGDKEKT